MKLVCISDTHFRHLQMEPIPDGDVLIHAGDSLGHGQPYELEEFLEWFSELPHHDKILISGNHDWIFERQPGWAAKKCDDYGVIYLNDSGIDIEGVKFWGSPVQPEFCNWAFNRMRGPDIDRHWQLIPEDTDVLITHGPPFEILDDTYMTRGPVGCGDLRKHVFERVRPKVHIFGHIHEGHGMVEEDGITFINAAQINDYYSFADGFKPIVYEVKK